MPAAHRRPGCRVLRAREQAARGHPDLVECGVRHRQIGGAAVERIDPRYPGLVTLQQLPQIDALRRVQGIDGSERQRGDHAEHGADCTMAAEVADGGDEKEDTGQPDDDDHKLECHGLSVEREPEPNLMGLTKHLARFRCLVADSLLFAAIVLICKHCVADDTNLSAVRGSEFGVLGGGPRGDHPTAPPYITEIPLNNSSLGWVQAVVLVVAAT